MDGRMATRCFCFELETLIIPDSVTVLGKDLLQGCTKLNNLSLPSSITEIPSGMLDDCHRLINLTVPDGVVKILPSYFIKNLKRLTLPPSVTRINKGLKDFNRSPVVTLYGFSGTYAEEYAAKQDVPFIPLALNRKTVQLRAGKSVKVRMNSLADCEWSSDAPEVASVDASGNVTAHKNGTAVITAELYGRKFECRITVGDYVLHKVRAGENLWRIAVRYQEIMELSDLISTKLSVGMLLKIPCK